MKEKLYLLGTILLIVIVIYFSVAVLIKLLPFILIAIVVIWGIKKFKQKSYLNKADKKDDSNYNQTSSNHDNFNGQGIKGEVIDVEYEELNKE